MSSTDDPGRYGRSFADVYDEWYAEAPSGDLVTFLSGRAASSATVLELGVGTGRVALPLAERGFAVTGLDASEEMLLQLRAKAGAARLPVAGRCGDVAEPTSYPEGPYDLVLAVFNLLFNLTSPDSQQRCLDAVSGVLGPDGSLVIESFVPAPITERSRNLETRSVEEDRVILIATESNPEPGTVSGSHIEITDQGVRLRPWTIRPLTPDGIDAMAARSGLALTERFEDFAETPYVDGASTHHVSVYRHRPVVPD